MFIFLQRKKKKKFWEKKIFKKKDEKINFFASVSEVYFNARPLKTLKMGRSDWYFGTVTPV